MKFQTIVSSLIVASVLTANSMAAISRTSTGNDNIYSNKTAVHTHLKATSHHPSDKMAGKNPGKSVHMAKWTDSFKLVGG